MTPTETVFGGIVIALVSGGLGTVIGSNGKVREKICQERTTTCHTMFDQRLNTIEQKVDRVESKLDKVMSNKLLGI